MLNVNAAFLGIPDFPLLSCISYIVGLGLGTKVVVGLALEICNFLQVAAIRTMQPATGNLQTGRPADRPTGILQTKKLADHS